MFSWNMNKRKVLLWKKVKIEFTLYVLAIMFTLFSVRLCDITSMGHRLQLWKQFGYKKIKFVISEAGGGVGKQPSTACVLKGQGDRLPENHAPALPRWLKHPALDLRYPSHWIAFHDLLRIGVRSVMFRICFENYSGILLFSIIKSFSCLSWFLRSTRVIPFFSSFMSLGSNLSQVRDVNFLLNIKLPFYVIQCKGSFPGERSWEQAGLRKSYFLSVH